MWSRVVAFVALLSLTALVSGCTAPSVIENSSVTVATTQSFFSLNDKTSYGASKANSAIVQAVNSSFNRYNEVPNLVTDPSFGSYQVVSNDPLTVKYTIADGVAWSDGVPVDASDLLLAWAANSGALNTEGFDDSDFVDVETGQYARPFPSSVVYFDGATSEGLQYVTTAPVIGDGGRSLTLSYDRYFADWPLVLQVGVPAHIVAQQALKLTPRSAASEEPTDAELRAAADDAKSALVEAIDSSDTRKLSAIANVWNSGFNFDAMPKDTSLLVSTGPYTITDFVPGDRVTLTANPRYTGANKPVIETVVVRYLPDGATQLAALADSSANVILPPATEDIATGLAALSDAAAQDGTAQDGTVQYGTDGVYEHLDVQFTDSRSGVFDTLAVRQAFLKTVPRAEILDAVIGPVRADATLRSSQLFLQDEPGYQKAIDNNGSSSFARVDIAGAQALLAEAGVVSPTVCILFDPSNPKRVHEFELIQTSAAKAGISVTNCSSSDWVNLLGTPGSYDAALFAWGVTNRSVAGAAAIFGTGGRNNLNYYSNPDVDALFDDLAVADDGAAADIRRQIDAQLFADGYGLPLYENPVIVAFDSTVTGVKLAPLSPGILWNLWEWKPAPQSSAPR